MSTFLTWPVVLMIYDARMYHQCHSDSVIHRSAALSGCNRLESVKTLQTHCSAKDLKEIRKQLSSFLKSKPESMFLGF